MPRSYGITNAQPNGSAPAVGLAGDTYYNTATKVLYISDGTNWLPVSSAAYAVAQTTAPAPANPPIAPPNGLLWVDTSVNTAFSPGEINYTQITAPVSVTATVEASGTVCITTPAITFDGAPVMVELFAPYVSVPPGAGVICFVSMFEGATQIGRFGLVSCTAGASYTQYTPFHGRLRFTPTAGAHTYTVTAYQSGGNCNFGAGAGGTGLYMPAFIRFTKV